MQVVSSGAPIHPQVCWILEPRGALSHSQFNSSLIFSSCFCFHVCMSHIQLGCLIHNQTAQSRSKHTVVTFFFFFTYLFYLFIYLWLCWVFVSVRGLSLVVASGGHSSSRCAGLSLSRPLLLRAEHRLQMRRLSSCGSRAQLLRGMWDLPRQGSNPCPLHWQADSQPLRHQGSPSGYLLIT